MPRGGIAGEAAVSSSLRHELLESGHQLHDRSPIEQLTSLEFATPAVSQGPGHGPTEDLADLDLTRKLEVDPQSLVQQRKEHSGSAVCGKASFDSMPVSLSTLPGSEDEIKLGQGPIRSMKGTDFINGCHGDACGENFQASILSVPEHRVIEPHLGEPEQIDDATGVNFEPKFDGPPEMAVPTPLPQSSFQPYNISEDEQEEYSAAKDGLLDRLDDLYDDEMKCSANISPEVNSLLSAFEQGIHPRVMSEGELSGGGWLSFLRAAISHLGGLSQPMFLEELITWQDQVLGHRVWIKLERCSGWSVKLEATRHEFLDALQDAAMLAVITMRQHFPCEFGGTPFEVLPMVPGQRSSWRPEDGAAAVRGDAVASAFMGIDDDEVERLLAVRFVSLFHERSESLLRLREHALKERLLIAEMEKMVEELDGSPTQTQELDRRIEELKNRAGEMHGLPAHAVKGYIGWSVFVTNEAREEMKPSEDGDEVPAALASSPAVSARARL
ncbi:B3 domain-containing protein [Hordeum vulgare]|nr:B3 domain-containing protein [Hordeum vulgare]